ncbi:methyl-accepting chemotaxis protein [Giesbergeria sp.]|uniref:methyl-accepting chemotaxis protein n=1 Tax=Giesbergeria sp. TaxID=2818473 RepID=UPI00260C4060|nr:methyl-accepting chemotaxis protein [Giesbergeria sp.]
MDWFKRMKVGSKLLLGFLTVALIGTAIGVLGILKTGQLSNMATQMYEAEMLGAERIARANLAMVEATRSLRSAMLSSTEQDRSSHLQRMQTRLDESQAELAQADKNFYTTQGLAELNETRNALQAYEVIAQQMAATLRAEPLPVLTGSTQQLFTLGTPAADKLSNLMTQLVKRKSNNAKTLNEETDAIYANIRNLLIALTVMGLLAGVTIGSLITRSLTFQLGGEPDAVAETARAIAAGDLSTSIDDSRAAPGSVVRAMHEMQESLRHIVGTVRASSDSIATGAGQISSGTADLSQRTEQQASNLEQTAASMEEIASTVQTNADTARQATQLSSSASQTAHRGGQVMTEVVTTMGEINEASRKIADIIAVIDGIAFQTNILALNAAVEAARAGEQGRGFAVVASEVRSLAGRSAEAAKEIKVLIGNSVDKVEAGGKLVDAAGQTMQDIVREVQRVTDLISEISASTVEQTSGIGQISAAVAQLDQVTQQNAALVEESAAAADSLNAQAQQLVQAVAVFKLGQHEQRAASQRSASSPAPAPRRAPALPQRSAASSAPKVAARAAPRVAAPPQALAHHSKQNDDDWEHF